MRITELAVTFKRTKKPQREIPIYPVQQCYHFWNLRTLCSKPLVRNWAPVSWPFFEVYFLLWKRSVLASLLLSVSGVFRGFGWLGRGYCAWILESSLTQVWSSNLIPLDKCKKSQNKWDVITFYFFIIHCLALVMMGPRCCVGFL